MPEIKKCFSNQLIKLFCNYQCQGTWHKTAYLLKLLETPFDQHVSLLWTCPTLELRYLCLRMLKKSKEITTITLALISKRTHWYVDEALLDIKGKLDKVHFAWKLQRKANRHEHFSVVGDGEVVCRRQNVRDASLNGISKVGVRCPDTFAPTVAQLVLRQRFLRGQIDSLGNGVFIRWLLQTVVRPVVVIEHVRIKGLSQPGVRQKLNKKIQTMRLYLRWSLAEFDVEDNQWDGNFNRFAVFSHRCNISVVVRWKYVHFILFGFLGHI